MREHPAAEPPDRTPVPDDQLRLVFTCCRPALAPASQAALTLRLVCGLQTAEIARAFLQPVATVAQRLSRARAEVRDAGIPVRVPPAHLLPERVPPALACIYLVFTEGYTATAGDALIHHDLCDEAIRLARLVVGLMPDEPEAAGLLALVLLQDSRRASRLSAAGEVVLLAEQDRSAWDRERIAEADEHLTRALRRRRPGPYQLQAAIAGTHAQAPSWEATDWASIAGRYAARAGWRPRRWSSSTGRWRWASPTARRRGWRCCRPWPTTPAWPGAPGRGGAGRPVPPPGADRGGGRRLPRRPDPGGQRPERAFLRRRLAEVTAEATGEA